MRTTLTMRIRFLSAGILVAISAVAAFGQNAVLVVDSETGAVQGPGQEESGDVAVQDDLPTTDENGAEVIRERYPNRSVKVERHVAQDSEGNYYNHGLWKMWDASGNLIAEGTYFEGERHGAWKRQLERADSPLFSVAPYNEFAPPFTSEASFRHGQMHGKWIITDSRDRQVSEIEFSSGQRHGKALWWYVSGRKMQDIDYSEGLMDGQLQTWAADGKERSNDTYQNGRKLALQTTSYPNGHKKSECTFLHAARVAKSGDEWWTATLATYETQGKDERHGNWTSWYDNGQVQVRGRYEHDQQVGKFTWWYSNGQKQAEGEFVDGRRNGSFIWWHPNGQKQQEGKYSAGLPDGRWTRWSDSGKVTGAEEYAGHHGDSQVAETPSDESKSADADSRSDTLKR